MRSWFADGAPRFARGCVVAIMLLAPVVFIPWGADGFQLTKLTVIWVLGFLALGAWAISSSERRAWLPPTRALPVMGVFVIALALATALSQNPKLSVVGLYGRFNGLIPTALYVALAVLTVGLWWDRAEGLASLAWAAVVASVPVAVYVVLQAHRLDPLHWGFDHAEALTLIDRHAQYPPSTLGNSNFAGAYLGIAAPAVVYGLRATKPWLPRLALLAVGAVDLLALLETRSRGGWLAALAGVVVMGVFGARRRVLVALAALVVVAAGAAGLVAFHERAQTGSAGGTVESVVLRSDTVTSRTLYWRAAWHMFLEHPVLGTGPDTFYARYPPERPARDGSEFGLTLPDKPHNVYLEYAVSAGVLGAGAYLVLVLLVFFTGAGRIGRVEDELRLTLAVLLGMLAAYLAQAVVSIDEPPLAVTGFVLLGAVVAIADPGAQRARRREVAARRRAAEGLESRQARRAARHRPAAVRHVVVGVLAVAVALVAVPPLAADIRARQAEIAARRHPTSPDATRKARSAMRLDPPEATFPAVLGDVNERKAAAESAPDAKSAAYAVARAAYAKALRMRPGHIYYMVSVARVDTSWATDVDPTRFPEADASWTAVVTFDPTDWEVHNLYAAMLNSWSNASGGDVGLRLRAVGELREVVHIQPLNVDAWVNLGKLQLAAGDTAQARASLEHSLALRPTDADAKSLLATLPPGPPPAGQ